MMSKPTPKKHLMFIRHGETQANHEQIAYGQTESPLSSRGMAQAQCSAEYLKTWEVPYHRVIASPMTRAAATAAPIAAALNLPLETNAGLIEGHLGDWEGVSYARLGELGYATRSMKNDDFQGHGGESPRQLARRMVNSIDEIVSCYPHDNIIIVSHGAAIAHALAWFLKTKPLFGYQHIMSNNAITELEVEDSVQRTFAIKRFNFVDHLPEDLRNDPVTKRSPRSEPAT